MESQERGLGRQGKGLAALYQSTTAKEREWRVMIEEIRDKLQQSEARIERLERVDARLVAGMFHLGCHISVQ